jgi:hypothetical protein
VERVAPGERKRSDPALNRPGRACVLLPGQLRHGEVAARKLNRVEGQIDQNHTGRTRHPQSEPIGRSRLTFVDDPGNEVVITATVNCGFPVGTASLPISPWCRDSARNAVLARWAESDKSSRFAPRLGKVRPKSSLTFPHSHSYYWIH